MMSSPALRENAKLTIQIHYILYLGYCQGFFVINIAAPRSRDCISPAAFHFANPRAKPTQSKALSAIS